MGTYNSLLKKIKKDNYMYMVVLECYESLKYILDILVVGDMERRYTSYTKSHVISPNFSVSYSLADTPFRVIFGVIDEIEESIGKGSLLEDLRMSELSTLHAICTDLIKLLVKSISKYNSQVSFILCTFMELIK